MVISDLKNNMIAIILKMLVSKNEKLKLFSMGLIEGSEIKMIKNDSKGSVILSINYNKIILSRSLACRIEIEKV